MNNKFENYIKNKAPNLYSIWKAGKAEITFTDGETVTVNVIEWDEDSLLEEQEPQLICKEVYFSESQVKSFKIIN